jgi:UDP-glucose 4-epimerase
MSRVVWGERDPDLCWAVNVEGTRLLLKTASAMQRPPWILLASSREVYGRPDRLPAVEDDPRTPINAYGRSKAAAEVLCEEAGKCGLAVAIARFSNVYGSVRDHGDRVVPAFCRASARGEPLHVNGENLTFDFVHVDDTVRGIVALASSLGGGERIPPIHFTTGTGTTLGSLAALATVAGGGRSKVLAGAVRSYDVDHFIGATTRARQLLGWQAEIPVASGVKRLVMDFQREHRLMASG